MTTYQKFKKLKIDFSAVEFEKADADDKYFCTPIGAHLIGRAGVDGIHYCTVRGQGEMVFAVNPSKEIGKNVFPMQSHRNLCVNAAQIYSSMRANIISTPSLKLF